MRQGADGLTKTTGCMWSLVLASSGPPWRTPRRAQPRVRAVVCGLVLAMCLGVATSAEGGRPWEAAEVPDQISFDDYPRGKRIPVPDAVRAMFEAERRKEWRNIWPKTRGPTFHLLDPDGRSLYLHRLGQGSIYRFVVVLHDPRTGKTSPKPTTLYAQWLLNNWPERRKRDNVIRLPIIAWEDLDGDGARELVLQDIYHNGTCSDRAVYSYYHVRDDLTFRLIFQRETRSVDCDGNWIERDLERQGPDRVRVGVRLAHPKRGPLRSLGWVDFARASPDQPFREVGRQGKGTLLTSADQGSDREFVKDWQSR